MKFLNTIRISISKIFQQNIVKYISVSIFTYTVLFGMMIYMNEYLLLKKQVSYALSYILGYILSFILQAKIVFLSGYSKKIFFLYILQIIFFFISGNFLFYFLNYIISINYIFSTLLVIFLLFPLRYLVAKKIVFKKTSNMKQIDFESGRLQPKYYTKNIVYRQLVNGFNKTISNFYTKALSIKHHNSIQSIIEVGVGEGQILEMCLNTFPSAYFHAVDIAEGILNIARNNLKEYSPQINFEIQDIHSLPYENISFDFVICCEVLEHVTDPKQGLKELNRILKPNGLAVLSVPNEPIWRICNMLRGAYIMDFGNTPGHINHWSSIEFQKLVTSHNFDILEIRQPLPWTALLVRKNN